MKKILIINKVQFGYHTDIYKWCQYLRNEYQVSEITLDQGQPKCSLQSVDVTYVSSRGSRLFRGIHYIFRSLVKLLFFRGIVIVCYFPGCEIFKILLPWKKMVLDIRTLDVSRNDTVRSREDSKIIKASSYYDYVTVISEGVRSKMNLSNEKSSILPLGADIIKTSIKQYKNPLNLLYVGTLTNRNIDITIKGVALALKNPSFDKILHYDIVGDGLAGELDDYRRLIKDLELEDVVTLHGYVQHERLESFFEKCNVGVSFVPMTDYYEFQPVTKTFEYVLSGLFTLATATSANKEVITEHNGLLISDTDVSFADALLKLSHADFNIDYHSIKNSLVDYEWKNLVNNCMSKILIKVNNLFNI